MPASKARELIEAQIAALFDAPTEQCELVRHYTLSAADPTAPGSHPSPALQFPSCSAARESKRGCRCRLSAAMIAASSCRCACHLASLPRIPA